MRNLCGMWLLGAMAVLGLSGPAALKAVAQPPAPAAVDVEKIGPTVGETVPDFSLPDQSGVTRSLKSLLGPKGAILVFFRSADW